MDKDKKSQIELSREAHIELDCETYDKFEKEKKQEQTKQVNINQSNSKDNPTPNTPTTNPQKDK